jgi:hypothetical protein
VPSDERTTRSAERCDLHPRVPSVGRCDGCGRFLCLSCATPVRGRLLGQECLAEELGAEVREDAGPESSRDLRQTIAGAAFAVALVSTFLPWSRSGEGAGVFGAWGRELHWSLLAAVAAVAGLLLWAARRRYGLHRPAWDFALTALGALVAVGALLAVLRPPSFSRVWFAPWIAVAAGVAALAATIPLKGSRPASNPLS